jgi:hypothetical protein
MLDKLLCNSVDSPLYHRHQPYELAAALQQIRDALDPTISWGSGAVSNNYARRASGYALRSPSHGHGRLPFRATLIDAPRIEGGILV